LALAYLFLVLTNAGPAFYRLDPASFLFDAGILATGAMRILTGEVMYRDWWAYYAPGQYYTLAGLFALFGPSLEVLRLWDFATRALLSVAVYGLSATLTSPKAGLIPFLVVVLWLASCGFYGYVMFPALALAIISMICLLKYFRRKAPVWLIATGATLGVATIYRHDVGIYAAACQAVGLAMFWLADPAQRAKGIVNSFAELGRAIGVLALAFMLPVLPVLIYFLRSVPLDELIYDFIVFPITVFPRSWSLPFPQFLPSATLLFTGQTSISALLVFLVFVWAPFYVPLFIYGLGIGVTVMLLIRPEIARRHRLNGCGILLLTLFGLALFNQVINRTDWIHQLPTSIMSIVLLSTLYYHASLYPGARRVIARTSVILLLVSTSWATRALIVPFALVTTALSPSSQTGPSILGDPAQSPRGQAEAVQFVQEHAADSEGI
jgi:hypothetical protein